VEMVLPVKYIGSGIRSLQKLREWWQTDVHSCFSSNEGMYKCPVVLEAIKQMNGRVTFQSTLTGCA
jgi:hypothetical protein